MPRGYQDPDCTVFVSNIESHVTEEHLWELFLQAGPLRNVHIPFDKASGKNKTFGFVTYRDECSVRFACELFNTLCLFRKPIYCKPAKDGKNSQSVSQTANSEAPNECAPDASISQSPIYPRHDRDENDMKREDTTTDQGRSDFSCYGDNQNIFSSPNQEFVTSHSNQNRSAFNRNLPYNDDSNTFFRREQNHNLHHQSSERHQHRRDYLSSYENPRHQPYGNHYNSMHLQANDRSINRNRQSTSFESPHQHSQYDPMRQDFRPRDRYNRRSRMQPY